MDEVWDPVNGYFTVKLSKQIEKNVFHGTEFSCRKTLCRDGQLTEGKESSLPGWKAPQKDGMPGAEKTQVIPCPGTSASVRG